MPNPVHKFLNEYFVGSILNKEELICLHTVEWFQVFLSNTNDSILHDSFICMEMVLFDL